MSLPPVLLGAAALAWPLGASGAHRSPRQPSASPPASTLILAAAATPVSVTSTRTAGTATATTSTTRTTTTTTTTTGAPAGRTRRHRRPALRYRPIGCYEHGPAVAHFGGPPRHEVALSFD
ncbi:MAG: hypothetical protein ACYDA6_05330, partial [Solirubrobacteraceae bacterium]